MLAESIRDNLGDEKWAGKFCKDKNKKTIIQTSKTGISTQQKLKNTHSKTQKSKKTQYNK